MNPFLPPEEFQARYARAAETMQRHGLEALLVTAESNLYYFSGHRPVVPWSTATRASFCLIPAAGDPILIVHAVWAGGAASDSPIQDVRSFTETMQPPLATLADAFRDRNLSKGRVGMEIGFEQRLGLSLEDYHKLQATLPEVEWADGSHALWELRQIKSAAELALMRRAGKITLDAFDQCYSNLRPGMTEAELASNLQAAIAAGGAEFGFMAPGFVPAAYEAMSRIPGNEPLKPGHLIWTDLGAIYGGYWSDFGRAAVIGKATDRQRRLWEGVHAITQAGVEAIRPGLPIPQVVEACRKEGQRQGLEMNFASGRIGHGLGLTLTEPPHIAGYDPQVLQPGMVITLEPGITSSEGVYIVEQDIAVTETGSETLSAGQWELWEVPA